MPSTSGCSPLRLELEHELVTLRAAVQGRGIKFKRPAIAKGGPDPKAAVVGKQAVLHGGEEGYCAGV